MIWRLHSENYSEILTQAIKALNNTEKLSQRCNSISAVSNLHRSLGEKFILIRGAFLVCQGSEQITFSVNLNVDLLLPGASIPHLTFTPTQLSDVTH